MKERLIPYISIILTIIIVSVYPRSARSAVNVYLSPGVTTDIQDRLIADVTTQYLSTLAPSPYLAGTWTIQILGRRPQPVCGQNVELPCNLDADIASLVAASTMTYVYGFADGMTYQRIRDNVINESFGIQCSTPSAFGDNISTVTWSAATCEEAIWTVDSAIYQQSLSTPTVIPPVP